MAVRKEVMQDNMSVQTEIRTAIVQMIVCLVAILLAQLFERPAHAQDVMPAGAAESNVGHFRIPGRDGAGVFGQEISILTNGNFVISDPNHDSPTRQNVGSVSLYDGKTFELISRIYGGQSFVQIGIGGVDELQDGNFVIHSPFYSEGGVNNIGALTWCNGVTGCSGQVNAENSLIGVSAGDAVGTSVVPLPDGGYLALSPGWDHAAESDAGAITRCPAGGCMGMVVSAANSLVGTTQNDRVGEHLLALMPNGDYVVRVPNWDNGAVVDVGAVIRCPAAGCTGSLSSANALVGVTAGDRAGIDGVHPIGNEYVVLSPEFDFSGKADTGAVTYCKTSCTGAITGLNSFVGNTLGDRVGSGGIVELGNNAYAIVSPYWSDGATSEVGAVTYCDRAFPCAGLIVKTRSLYGDSTGDSVGSGGVNALSNGSYVVASPIWDSAAVSNAGAVTWCSADGSCKAQIISEANSLHGSTLDDRVGQHGVMALENGAYVVRSPSWDNGGVMDAGAVTFCAGATGCTPGAVSSVNSLVGDSTLDQVARVQPLANGNYVVYAPLYNEDAHTDGGKAVLCSGITGCTGSMAAVAGLEASHAGQSIGLNVVALNDGNFVVRSNWTRGGVAQVGAVTWCNGTTGCPTSVSEGNSLVGAITDDQVGTDSIYALVNGAAAITSASFDFAGTADAGAVSVFYPGGAGTGDITQMNSVVGAVSGAGVSLRHAYNPVHAYLIVGLPEENAIAILMTQPSLAVLKSGSGAGMVTSAPGGVECGEDCYQTYASGTSVTLTAVAHESSNFTGWSGACSGVGVCVVDLTAGHVVTANFDIKMLEVTVADASIGGAIEVAVLAVPAADGDGAAAAGEEVVATGGSTKLHAYGTVLEFKAVPDPGYVFVGWLNSLSGKQNPQQRSVKENMTVGAIFRPSDIADVQTFLPIVIN